MYLPKQFDASQTQWAYCLMREHPFACIVSNDDDGFPFASHFPLHLQLPTADLTLTKDLGVLLGHCAKSNPHWRYLQSRPQALVVFAGPQGYLSPAVYPDLQRVPTWNYLTVHAKVSARLLEGDEAKDAMLKQLIADHEMAYAEQWRNLPAEWTAKMLKGIVAFELKITSLQCKLKLNQHRPESHAAMYARGVASQDGNQQALAKWMQRLGMVPSPENSDN